MAGMRIARWALAALFVVAGVAHLVNPLPFVAHLPPAVPLREALVAATGWLEIVLGLLLLGPRRHRRTVGYVVAAYLVAVFPANVYVAVADVDVDGLPPDPYPWLRLPLQVVLIAWALWCTAPRGQDERRRTAPAEGAG